MSLACQDVIGSAAVPPSDYSIIFDRVALPTGRTWQNLSVLVPGVSVPLSSTDVGGSNNERYQTMTVHGSRADQMPLVSRIVYFRSCAVAS